MGEERKGGKKINHTVDMNFVSPGFHQINV